MALGRTGILACPLFLRQGIPALDAPRHRREMFIAQRIALGSIRLVKLIRRPSMGRRFLCIDASVFATATAAEFVNRQMHLLVRQRFLAVKKDEAFDVLDVGLLRP